jgi:hypothetical protein
MGMRTRASLEGKSSQGEERSAQERVLVPRVLQLATKVLSKKRHRINESFGDRSQWQMPVYRILEQQGQTELAMCTRTSLASSSNFGGTRYMVSGMRPKHAAWFAPLAGGCGK